MLELITAPQGESIASWPENVPEPLRQIAVRGREPHYVAFVQNPLPTEVPGGAIGDHSLPWGLYWRGGSIFRNGVGMPNAMIPKNVKLPWKD